MNTKEKIEQISASEFYQKYLPGFTPKGKKEMICLCPFHEDKETPNLSINMTTGKYNCFACNKGGDKIQFYMDKHEVDFKTALRNIAKDFGIEEDKEQSAKKGSHKSKMAAPQDDQGQNMPPIPQKVVDSYISNLEKDLEAISFLEEKRGISSDTRKKFSLGLDKYKHFVIPIQDKEGKICNLRIYNPTPKNPK